MQGFLAGSSGYQGTNDGYLIKTNSIGDTLWTKFINYSSGSVTFFSSVCESLDSNIVVTGGVYTAAFGHYNLYISKLDFAGNILWQKIIVDGYESAGTQIISDTAGFYIGGTTNSPDLYDFYLLRTNTSGDSLWSSRIGGTGYQNLYSLSKTNENGLIMSGQSTDSSSKMFVVKLHIPDSLHSGITTLPNEFPFLIFPNPANNNIHLRFNSIENLQIEIVDISGRVYYQSNLISEAEKDINLENFPAGFYLIRLKQNHSESENKFLIIH